MAISSSVRSPLSLLALVVLLALFATTLRKRNREAEATATPMPAYCQGLSEEECRAVGFQEIQGDQGGREETSGAILPAGDVCVSVGYLCAEVDQMGELQILRWPEDTPVITVWVPLPSTLDPAMAREFQRAAVRGIQVWNRHPFPLNISTRTMADDPDVTIAWVFSLGGNRLGEARRVLSGRGNDLEMRIPSLTLVTHRPGNLDLTLTPDEILLVAAHEMGHALGLPHSDDPRDLMYPENSAWRPTGRDYRTMEAVYQIPNGSLIKR